MAGHRRAWLFGCAAGIALGGAVAAGERTVISQAVIDAAPARVWAALTTEQGLEQWLAKDATVDLGPGSGGGNIRWMIQTEGTFREITTTQQVIFHQAERTLAYRVALDDDVPFCLPCYEKTWTVLRLEGLPPASTRATLEVCGLEEGAEWDKLRDAVGLRNADLLQKLRNHFATTAADLAPTRRSTRASVELGAPPEEIFKSFMTGDGLVKLWSVAQAEVDFRIGGQIRTRYDKDKRIGEPGTITNTILAYEPDRMLAIKATAPDGAGDHIRAICETGWSVLTLEPLGPRRTRLTVTGFGYGEGPEFDKAFKHFEAGNQWTCDRMRQVYPLDGAEGTPSAAASPSNPDADEFRMIDTSLFVAGGPVKTDLHKEVVVNAAPGRVFEMWTTETGMKDLLGVESNIDLRIGGPMELYFGPNLPKGERGSDGCQILSYMPGRMLSYSWNAPPKFPTERAKRTWIVIFFHELPDGKTRVEFNHLGFGPSGEGAWDDVRQYFDRAWSNVLKALGQKLGEG